MGVGECREGGAVPIALFCRVCSSGTSRILARIKLRRLFSLAISNVSQQLPMSFQFPGVRLVVNRAVPLRFCAPAWGAPRFFRCIHIIRLYFSSIVSVRVGS